MPIRSPLISMTHGAQSRLIEWAAYQLERRRQSFRREAAGHAQRRQTQITDRACVLRYPQNNGGHIFAAADIHIRQLWRGDRHRRCQQDIAVSPGRSTSHLRWMVAASADNAAAQIRFISS
jgi:hypothetical protein